jgi:acyl-CoA synthetase (AMP-forming)/AMP-acid ligase II
VERHCGAVGVNMILATDWIAFHADRTPEKLALIDQATDRRYTYAQLDERSARLAAYLRAEWGSRGNFGQKLQ